MSSRRGAECRLPGLPCRRDDPRRGPRSHIGSGVLYCTAADEAQHAVIARVLGSWVFARCSSDDRTKPAAPEDLTLLAGRGTEAGETLTAGDLLAASQASLNEIVAAIIRDG